MGQPRTLGTRDWAGLKRHGADRDLAGSLASEGRGEAPRGRLGAAQTGTVLSFLSDVMCNFRPCGLNASRCMRLVRVCSGHWKFVALWHFELSDKVLCHSAAWPPLCSNPCWVYTAVHTPAALGKRTPAMREVSQISNMLLLRFVVIETMRVCTDCANGECLSDTLTPVSPLLGASHTRTRRQ